MAYDLENFFMFLVIYFYLKSIEVQTEIHGHRPGCGNRGHFSLQVHSPNAHSIPRLGCQRQELGIPRTLKLVAVVIQWSPVYQWFFFLSCYRLYLTLCIKSYQPKIWKLSMLSSISFVALHFAYKAVIHLESILWKLKYLYTVELSCR